MQDFSVEVVFAISAENSEDAKLTVHWYLLSAQELFADQYFYTENFPNWFVTVSKELHLLSGKSQ